MKPYPRYHYDIIQGSDRWFEIKLGDVSGSMFAIAKGNGQARKDYMEALIDELRTGRPRETFVNAHMQRGTEMEPFARAAYEKKTGVKVQEVGFVEYNENIGVSPDGMIEPGGRLEIKCPTLEVHNKTVKADKVPSSHKPQIQGTLWVTEGKWLDFVSYHPDAETPLFVKRVYPDEAYITELKIRIYMFIADMKAMMKETEDSRKDSEMQKTGKITNLVKKGGYTNSRNDYIYTFWIGIETDAGIVKGEIGSKSETYPKSIGDQITVDITNDPEHGNKLKAVNPQYSGGGGQGQGRSQGGNQGRDFDKENKGKCFCNYVSSKLASGVKATILSQDGAEISALWKLAEMSIDGPASGGMNESQQGQYDGSSGPRNLNSDWVGDDPEKPTDDIPF